MHEVALAITFRDERAVLECSKQLTESTFIVVILCYQLEVDFVFVKTR